MYCAMVKALPIKFNHAVRRLLLGRKASLNSCHLSWTFKNEIVDKVASGFCLSDKEPIPLHFLSTLILIFIAPLPYILAVYASFFLPSPEDWTFLRLCVFVQFHICMHVLCPVHLDNLLNVCWVKPNWMLVHFYIA